MINKQTLVIKEKMENEIIAISGSRSAYVDSDYFKNTVGEDTTNKNFMTYAVNYHCARVDWILNEQIGLNFMKELLRQKRRDLFNTMYIKMLTAYLYKRYSKKIMRTMLPVYILHQITLFVGL